MNNTPNNPSLWSFLVIFTVVTGAVATWLIVRKEHYFPGLYAAKAHVEPSHSNVAVHADTIAHEAPETSVGEVAGEEHRQLNIGDGEGPAAGDYVLVAGSFLSEQYAQQFQATLEQRVPDMDAQVVSVNVGSSMYYRVVAGYAASFKAMTSAKRSIEEAGYSQAWIFRQ